MRRFSSFIKEAVLLPGEPVPSGGRTSVAFYDPELPTVGSGRLGTPVNHVADVIYSITNLEDATKYGPLQDYDEMGIGELEDELEYWATDEVLYINWAGFDLWRGSLSEEEMQELRAAVQGRWGFNIYGALPQAQHFRFTEAESTANYDYFGFIDWRSFYPLYERTAGVSLLRYIQKTLRNQYPDLPIVAENGNNELAEHIVRQPGATAFRPENDHALYYALPPLR